VIDFQAPLSHTLVRDKIKRKGKFEKMFLDGRPPVNVGVTSGGDVFGGSAVTFSDVLGDQQFNLYAASISQYRTLSFSYMNLARRFNWAVQGYSMTQFFYGQLDNVFYDPVYAGVIDRDFAVATRTIRGGTGFGIFPFNRYRRLELSGGVLQYNESYNDPSVQDISQQYQQQQYGTQLLRSGTYVPLGAAYVQETTVFREFGPLAGSTMRLSYEVAPKIGNTLDRQTFDLDARKYYRLGGSGLLALRGRGFKSWGGAPDFMYFGGNSEMRGYDYLQFVGSNSMFVNAELRFPFIEAMLTPVGVLGGIRGVFFANMGGANFNNLSDDPARGSNASYKWISNKSETYRPIVGYGPQNLVTGGRDPIFGDPVTVDGLRLVDARASYGIGLETFALGFPIHFDWAWKTMFNKQWEDLRFATVGGSSAFRKPKFSVWIGYDF
jgi:outer membrane protein assembly factor BamA